jgi:hypothetical protein
VSSSATADVHLPTTALTASNHIADRIDAGTSCNAPIEYDPAHNSERVVPAPQFGIASNEKEQLDNAWEDGINVESHRRSKQESSES